MDIYFIDLISDEKQDKIKYKKLQHKVSRLILNKLLKEKYEIYDEVQEENGKPYIYGNSIFFSISHSANLIALAFDKKSIGIDVELIKKRKFDDILNYFNISVEKPIAEDEFFQIWTTYEAEFKSGTKKNLKNFKYKNFMCAISFEGEELFNFYELKISINNFDFLSEFSLKNNNKIELKQLDNEFFEFISPSDKRIKISNS